MYSKYKINDSQGEKRIEDKSKCIIKEGGEEKNDLENTGKSSRMPRLRTSGKRGWGIREPRLRGL